MERYVRHPGRQRGGGHSRRVAAAGTLLVLVLVFALLAWLAGWLAATLYPTPDQAATWALIGRFVAGLVAVTAALQAWSWLRR
ncbi:hypothetical protein [Dokdonella sp.]|uniref:hypothetical protein n=1 Tax=Dokdonella sp. TaxID=2291710 RepID=UPI0031CC094F|nr:hypothetical protein [Dokdonella sp.]